jgi:hypothetical protein
MCVFLPLLSGMQIEAPYCHPWPVLPTLYFHIISYRHGFRVGGGGSRTYHVCFDFLYKFVRNIPHSKRKLARYYRNIHTSSLMLNETRILSTDFRKIAKYQISWKSVQRQPSCSMRANRMMKLIDAVRNFAIAPKKDFIFFEDGMTQICTRCATSM